MKQLLTAKNWLGEECVLVYSVNHQNQGRPVFKSDRCDIGSFEFGIAPKNEFDVGVVYLHDTSGQTRCYYPMALSTEWILLDDLIIKPKEQK